jgi:hypothetical protein
LLYWMFSRARWNALWPDLVSFPYIGHVFLAMA